MHIVMLTRGAKHDIDRFITELQGKYMPFRYPFKDKELQDGVLQLLVQPIQLWSICFPEQHKDSVLYTLLGSSDGKAINPKMNKIVWALRKGMGLKKIPEYKKDFSLPLYRQNIETIGIGIKEDYFTNPKTGEKKFNPTEEERKEMFEGI